MDTAYISHIKAIEDMVKKIWEAGRDTAIAWHMDQAAKSVSYSNNYDGFIGEHYKYKEEMHNIAIEEISKLQFPENLGQSFFEEFVED